MSANHKGSSKMIPAHLIRNQNVSSIIQRTRELDRCAEPAIILLRWDNMARERCVRLCPSLRVYRRVHFQARVKDNISEARASPTAVGDRTILPHEPLDAVLGALRHGCAPVACAL